MLAFNDMAQVREAYEAALRFDPAHPNALENMQRFFSSEVPAAPGGQGVHAHAQAHARAGGTGRREGKSGGGGGEQGQGGKRSLDELASRPPADFAARGWGAAGDGALGDGAAGAGAGAGHGAPARVGAAGGASKAREMPRKGKAGKGKGRRKAQGEGGGDGKRVRLQATTTAAATTTSTAADNTATPTRVSAPATQPRTHKEPRARPGRDWREDDYRAALQACAHAPPSTSVTTPRRTVPRDADAPAAAGQAPSAEAPSQCRLLHRKLLFNNLGVILVQKHTPSDQDGVRERELAEAVELLRAAVALQPDWPEAQHNLRSAIAAHAHALEAPSTHE